ncbi:hypothetical protein F2P81_004869 [Scophthalmus maximus]|uniref:Uncharacterized protein n=1 Tax=Scophthalmus maximus TaxID=52904 RepID=A0A6A4TNF7_SCOMX|nr:hypothetical protein F2P81_004869 [Scophthalmus maximus]
MCLWCTAQDTPTTRAGARPAVSTKQSRIDLITNITCILEFRRLLHTEFSEDILNVDVKDVITRLMGNDKNGERTQNSDKIELFNIANVNQQE